MAKLADAADLKSADPKGLWGFESPSRHQLSILNVLAGTDHRRSRPEVSFWDKARSHFRAQRIWN